MIVEGLFLYGKCPEVRSQSYSSLSCEVLELLLPSYPHSVNEALHILLNVCPLAAKLQQFSPFSFAWTCHTIKDYMNMKSGIVDDILGILFGLKSVWVLDCFGDTSLKQEDIASGFGYTVCSLVGTILITDLLSVHVGTWLWQRNNLQVAKMWLLTVVF